MAASSGAASVGALIGTAVVLPIGLFAGCPWSEKNAPREIERPSYTMGRALLTPGFWVFGLATSVYGLLIVRTVALFNVSRC